MSEKVSARGLQFDVRVGGPAEGPVALLLHGFPEHSGMWEPVVPMLHAAGVRTVAPDQRGYSPGARPEGIDAYRITELTLDALAILDSLGVAGPVHAVGHDWGANVGWRLAMHHPDRVATYTGVSVPHPAAFAAALAADSDQRERSRYIVLFQQPGRAEEVLLADDAQRLRALFDQSGLSPEGVDRYVAPLREPGALTAALNWYRAYTKEYRGDPTPVTVPTTFVWSDADRAIGPVAALACHEFVKADYRMLTLNGISHWIAEQSPAVLAGAILDRIRAA